MHPDGKNYHSVRMVNSASAIDTEYSVVIGQQPTKMDAACGRALRLAPCDPDPRNSPFP